MTVKSFKYTKTQPTDGLTGPDELLYVDRTSVNALEHDQHVSTSKYITERPSRTPIISHEVLWYSFSLYVAESEGVKNLGGTKASNGLLFIDSRTFAPDTSTRRGNSEVLVVSHFLRRYAAVSEWAELIFRSL